MKSEEEIREMIEEERKELKEASSLLEKTQILGGIGMLEWVLEE